MKIIRQLIEKKLENEDTFKKNLRRQFALEEHISAYMMALTFLGLYDPLIHKKIKIWKKFISSSNDKQLQIYNIILSMTNQENEIIIRVLNKIEELKDSDTSGDYGSVYILGTFGVLAYEFEAGE